MGSIRACVMLVVPALTLGLAAAAAGQPLSGPEFIPLATPCRALPPLPGLACSCTTGRSTDHPIPGFRPRRITPFLWKSSPEPDADLMASAPGWRGAVASRPSSTRRCESNCSTSGSGPSSPRWTPSSVPFRPRSWSVRVVSAERNAPAQTAAKHLILDSGAVIACHAATHAPGPC